MRVDVWMEKEEAEWLRIRSQQVGTSRAEWVRRALSLARDAAGKGALPWETDGPSGSPADGSGQG